jgi:hypothetical protein
MTTYAELKSRIEATAVLRTSEDPDFAIALPGIIANAELRCLGDCDFPSARTVSRITIPAGAWAVGAPTGMVVPRALWAVLFTGAVQTGRRNLLRRDPSFLREYLEATTTPAALPKYFATQDQSSFLLAPGVIDAVQVDVEYTFRPPGLSDAVPETWLSRNYEDFLFYACMVGVTGYQKEFSGLGANPAAPVSWEKLYQDKLAIARNEAATGKGWGAFDRTPTPPPPSLSPSGR